jgi:transposase InsO family protein
MANEPGINLIVAVTDDAWFRMLNRMPDLKEVNFFGAIGLAHARVEIERRRRECNEERPKKVLGGLTPALYAKQLAGKALTATAAL